MSEIKPVAWIDPEYLPSLRHELTGTILRLNKGDSETMPLYTADQLAEAVAAERERCAKVCEAHSNGALCSAMIGGPDAQGLQSISYAHKRAAQSIRSAMK